jgi:hypothetical protein
MAEVLCGSESKVKVVSSSQRRIRAFIKTTRPPARLAQQTPGWQRHGQPVATLTPDIDHAPC